MQPSPLVERIVQTADDVDVAGMRVIMEREKDFPSLLQAQLTGIGLDSTGRDMANRVIDTAFQANRLYGSLPLATNGRIPELVIGSGFHAATYVATRAAMGKPVPVVFESQDYAGGAFAIRSADGTYPGVFNLNSRNRRGLPGLSGDNEAQLNYLPGAPIQASALSNSEYQTNADMALIVRLTLAQYAPQNVFPGFKVGSVEHTGDDNTPFQVSYEASGKFRQVIADRVIDARGLGQSRSQDVANGTNVLTFQQFMTRMSGLWPLRGLRNVAVVGGGDSGKCVVEALLGLGPDSAMSAVELDVVNRVDWFALGEESTYEEYCRANRGRYRAIGRYLRADKMGNQRLIVFNGDGRISPVALPNGLALVNSRSYDLVIMATGNKPDSIDGLDYPYSNYLYVGNSTRAIASSNEADYGENKRYRIGPRAEIPFDDEERQQGVTAIDNNRVAMFRLATRTAAAAVRLS